MDQPLLAGPGPIEPGRRAELHGIRENRPVVDVLLSAEVGFRAPDRFGQGRSFNRKRCLARTMLVPGVVANGLDETHIE
jgi:hypothetical protein